MKSRLIALILASLMFAMTACSENPAVPDETESDTAQSVPQESESETVVDVETTDYYNQQEAVDYEGWEMNMASVERMPVFYNYVNVLEATGDEMNDALYYREIAIEDKFNIVINDPGEMSVPNAFKNSITSGTRDYALGADLMEDGGSLIVSGFLRSFTDMELQLDMPWWDKGAQETLTINGKMFYGLSDASFDHYEGLAVLFYNGVLLEKNNIEKSPYDLFVEDKWTLDAMYDMITTVCKDTNGDGKMEQQSGDIFGCVGRDLRYQPALPSSKVDIIWFDEEAKSYVSSLTNETVMKIGDKLRRMLADKSLSYMEGTYSKEDFISGYALFDSHLIGDFRSYRENEDDYGIIGWPALEDGMQGYAYVRNPCALYIPIDVKDIERLSTIIDAYGAYGHDYILKNYIDKAVVGKGARDAESASVIRDMIDRRYYDITYAYGLFALADGWAKAVRDNAYASIEQKFGKKIQKDINVLMDVFYDH